MPKPFAGLTDPEFAIVEYLVSLAPDSVRSLEEYAEIVAMIQRDKKTRSTMAERRRLIKDLMERYRIEHEEHE